jgi:20S proteasome subunit beta 5
MPSFLLIALLFSLVYVSCGSWHPFEVSTFPTTSGSPVNALQDTKPILPDDLNNIQYHGTTTLAFTRADCVVICVDSKASVGNYVGSRGVKKVFPVSKSVVATMAGGAADCAYWIRRVATAMRSLEYKYAASFNAKAIARTLASSLRQYKGMGEPPISTLAHKKKTC